MATVVTSCGGIRVHASPSVGPNGVWDCPCPPFDTCTCGCRLRPTVLYRVERAQPVCRDKFWIIKWIPVADAKGTADGEILDAGTLSEGRIVHERLRLLDPREWAELLSDVVQGTW